MIFIVVIMCLVASSQISCDVNYSPSAQVPLKYEGTLTTLNNHTFSITDISLAGRQCACVYQAPCKTDTLVTNLSYNPKNQKRMIRLAEIKEIEIPYPYTKWQYKHRYFGGTDFYLLIKIIWNETKRTPGNFLIEPKRRLSLTIQNDNRSSPLKIPFTGFKKINIRPMPR